MARNDPHTEKAARSAKPNLDPASLTEAGTKGIESMMTMQTEFFNAVREINEGWFGRANSEIELTSEFFAKLAAARSIPDAMAASQEWANRRMEMLAEDSRHLLSDGQKIMGAGARSASSGWTGGTT